MTHFLKTLKAIEIYSKAQRLEREKQFSIQISSNEIPDYSITDRFYKFYVDYVLCGKVKQKLLRIITGKSQLSNISQKVLFVKAKILTNGTFENYVVRSVVGFLFGALLTYIFFVFLLSTAFDITNATLISALLAPILCLGLAFSSNVRCVTFLILPQFFSHHGRQALIAYAFFLAATGPAKNTFHNMNILSDSLSCTQEQLRTANENILELIHMPLNALNSSLKRVFKSLKSVIQKVKDILISMKRVVVAIMSTIKGASDWLMESINFCNKKLGTPYERCMKVLSESSDDCKVQVFDALNWMCNIAYVGAPVCYSVKWIDYLCDFVDWVVNSESVFGVIKKKMREFERHIKTLFYVSISVRHSYSFQTNSSKNYEEVTRGILTEIRERTAFLVDLSDRISFSSVFLFFAIYMFYQVIVYRYRYLSSETFDNRFVTNDLVEIDWRRTLHNRETILPLNRKERTKYISLFSARMIAKEKVMFTKSAIFLSVSTFKLVLYMLLDYSLYWLLYVVRAHGRIQTNPRGVSPLSLNVNGEGLVADILKSIISSFKFVGAVMNFDTLPCLPDPIPPDTDKYKHILFLMGISWIFAICQPFGIRLRHYVMGIYHPEIARTRSVWLYNHILRKRSSFVKFMRRELRRKFSKSTNALSASNSTKITFRQKLLATIPFFSYFFQDNSVGKSCLVCGTYETKGIILHHCPTPGCIGTYCSECYAELQNICTICKKPLDYGDISDVSEEKDSSEDETLRDSKEQKQGKKIKLKDPEKIVSNEQVLSLYREYHSDSSELSNVSTNIHEPILKGPYNERFCRKINYTPKNIFEKNLPICTIDWGAQTDFRTEILSPTKDNALVNKAISKTTLQLPKPGSNYVSDETSDDIIMKEFSKLNPKVILRCRKQSLELLPLLDSEDSNHTSDYTLESDDYFYPV